MTPTAFATIPLPDRSTSGGLNWALLGSANIARANFIPALRSAGGNIVTLGSRSPERATSFIEANGLAAKASSYAGAIAHPLVEAVYVALPNHLHDEWAKAALRAGKAVLCEKPLGRTVEEVSDILDVAGTTTGPLWEAFAFPFHAQWSAILQIIQEQTIGELREVHSNFHFVVTDPNNIRWNSALAGGSLNDVGCYPVHLAALLFKAEPLHSKAAIVLGGGEVDAECQALIDFGSGRRLLFSCGMRRWRDTSTRLVGTAGEIRLTDPYHPGPADTLTIIAGRQSAVRRLVPDEPSFTEMLRRITASVRGSEPPRHLAAEDSLGTARAVELVRRSWTVWR